MSAYEVINPATNEAGRSVAAWSADQIEAAVTAAHAATQAWRNRPLADRIAAIRRVADLHTERREQLAEIIVREMGKTMAGALGEVDFCADIYTYFAEAAEAALADEHITLRGGEGTAIIRKQALGVLLGIMPWNFPYYQVARFAGPNIVLGNAVLIKHSHQCPDSAQALQDIFDAAGVPAGVYLNTYVASSDIESIIADPRVRGVSLTGSERAGAAVAQLAGKYLKKVVLELGGSDPFILLSTDDMDATVEAAVVARMESNAQACNAGKRFIVVANLYDEFVAKFVPAMTGQKVGDPQLEDTEIGPLSSTDATQTLVDQVNRAVGHGASLTQGGQVDGNFFPGAVLTGVTPGNEVYREELFGPVAMVFKAADEADAVRIANDTDFGLGSYLFTTDPVQADRVANQIEAGMVYVNCVAADAAETPFGGVKRSGFGRELGRGAFEEFANRKLIRTGA
jgi:succinate-semialdehyde dehydrogenase/glutarate-semialdehyde dehydrogenase